jgi:hypothetical protein
MPPTKRGRGGGGKRKAPAAAAAAAVSSQAAPAAQSAAEAHAHADSPLLALGEHILAGAVLPHLHQRDRLQLGLAGRWAHAACPPTRLRVAGVEGTDTTHMARFARLLERAGDRIEELSFDLGNQFRWGGVGGGGSARSQRLLERACRRVKELRFPYALFSERPNVDGPASPPEGPSPEQVEAFLGFFEGGGEPDAEGGKQRFEDLEVLDVSGFVGA